MKNKLKSLLGILFVSFFLLAPLLSFAQTNEPDSDGQQTDQTELSNPGLKDAFNTAKEVGREAGYKTESVDIFSVVVEGIRMILSVLGVIFIVLVIYSGFNWMTAGGSDEKIAKSKKVLKNSAFGLIIILGAYSISFFVVEALSFLNVQK